MPGLNPSQDNGYPDWSLAWFSLDHPAKCQLCTSLKLWQLLSKSFQILCCINYPTIWWYIVWDNASTIKFKKSSFPYKHYEDLEGWWCCSSILWTSVQDGGEWSTLHPIHFTPRERALAIHWTRVWVGLTAGLDIQEMKTSLAPARIQTLNHPACIQLHIVTTISSTSSAVSNNCHPYICKANTAILSLYTSQSELVILMNMNRRWQQLKVNMSQRVCTLAERSCSR